MAESLRAGLVINAPAPDVLRFAPSLLVSESDIDRALGILGPVLGRLATGTATAVAAETPPPEGSPA
ncbi:MAG: hypothetical protein ACRDWB_11650 [Acidimicrobiales bacterium]